jgi:hypothetical protein
MSDRFLEQAINIEFCLKLRRNANDTCTVLSETYGGEAVERSHVFFSGVNGSKRVASMWEVVKEVVVQDITELMKMEKNA